MKDYKEVIKRNYITIVVIFTILLCILLTLSYAIFQNSSLDSTSEARLRGPVAFYISPTQISPSVNQTYPVTVIAKLDNAENVQGFTLKLKFDNTKINVSSISLNVGTSCIGLSDSNDTLPTVNQNGVINICSEVQSKDGASLIQGNNTLASLTLLSMDNNNSQVTFDTVDPLKNALFQIDSNGFIFTQKVSSFGILSFSNKRGK